MNKSKLSCESCGFAWQRMQVHEESFASFAGCVDSLAPTLCKCRKDFHKRIQPYASGCARRSKRVCPHPNQQQSRSKKRQWPARTGACQKRTNTVPRGMQLTSLQSAHADMIALLPLEVLEPWQNRRLPGTQLSAKPQRTARAKHSCSDIASNTKKSARRCMSSAG